MKFSEWEVEYGQILQRFGFSRGSDRAAAHLLARMVRDRRGRTSDLLTLLRGRSVIVVGGGPGPLPAHLFSTPEWMIVTADGATSRVLASGAIPALILTDLDGDMPTEVRAHEEGAAVLIHAHGDNVLALRRWVPRLKGTVWASMAAEPREGLLNVGGFTDGDRAVFLAEAAGARRLLLAGFDFHHARADEGPRKLAKLAIAERLIGEVAARGRMPVGVFTPRGVRPWSVRTTRPAGRRSGKGGRSPAPRGRRAPSGSS